jgi:hypothetical protein
MRQHIHEFLGIDKIEVFVGDCPCPDDGTTLLLRPTIRGNISRAALVPLLKYENVTVQMSEIPERTRA